MRPDQFEEFVDPETQRPLHGAELSLADDQVRSGRLTDLEQTLSYPVRDFIPRFVPATNYAGNFGLQWQIHSRTQLDSYTGATYSHDRLFETTGWPRDLSGQRILEAGSGAGRFTEVLLATGAKVYSFDYSDAVVANYANNGKNPRLCLFQGDIYKIPFPPRSFDRVICLGVLQHTPDVEKSFKSLAGAVRPGGQLAVDCYIHSWRANLHWKFALRPITTRMNPRRLYRVVNWYAPKLMPIARVMRKAAGKAGHRLVPILDQSDKYVPPAIQREWTILDTYDALSAAYDQPQTEATLRQWFADVGFENVDVRPGAIGLSAVGNAPFTVAIDRDTAGSKG